MIVYGGGEGRVCVEMVGQGLHRDKKMPNRLYVHLATICDNTKSNTVANGRHAGHIEVSIKQQNKETYELGHLQNKQIQNSQGPIRVLTITP